MPTQRQGSQGIPPTQNGKGKTTIGMKEKTTNKEPMVQILVHAVEEMKAKLAWEEEDRFEPRFGYLVEMKESVTSWLIGWKL